MAVSEHAGLPAEPSLLVDVDRLVAAYYDRRPDVAVPAERVAFGTSGHRGSSLTTSFNEAHIIATSAAICRYRRRERIDGPLFIGRDTHALSGPAFESAIEVLVADGVDVRVDSGDGYTPTPAVSHAILVHNRGRRGGLADGIVVTPSHNPPADGGFKYNPPTGGPADAAITGAIEREANAILAGGPGDGLDSVGRVPFERARRATGAYDFMGTYVADLGSVVDMDAIRTSGLHLGVD
jgi:phosphoglucomutase